MTRRRGLPVLALAATLVLAACSSDEEASTAAEPTTATATGDLSPVPDAPTTAAGATGTGSATSLDELLVAAPQQAREAGSARFELSGSLTDAETGAVVELAGEGASDYETNTTRMVLDVGEQSPTGEPIEFIQSGSTFFLAAAALGLPLPSDAGWLRLDLDALGEQSGIAPPGFEAFGEGADPTTALEALRGTTGELETIGEEEVRGVDTTHYRTMISRDAAAAAAETDPDAQQRLEDSALPETYPVDVWLGDDGLPRRIQFAPSAESGGTETDRFTLEFYDYGEDVMIDVPSDEQVLDLEDLLAGFGTETTAGP